jgi:hypothetical protein
MYGPRRCIDLLLTTKYFWTMLDFFACVALFWLLIYVVVGVFRNPGLSGAAKALDPIRVFHPTARPDLLPGRARRPDARPV